jgi:hypothetical protein
MQPMQKWLVEHLNRKLKIMSSNPSITKKKEEKETQVVNISKMYLKKK